MRVMTMDMILHHFDKFIGIICEHIFDIGYRVGTYFAMSYHFELLIFHRSWRPRLEYFVRTLHLRIWVDLSEFCA